VKAVLITILSELHGLTTWCIHRYTVLTLVGFESDVRLPFALEVSLLGGNSFLTTKQAIAAEVLVAFLHKTKPRLVPKNEFGTDVSFLQPSAQLQGIGCISVQSGQVCVFWGRRSPKQIGNSDS
jgi:hypothetical protein